MTAFDIDYAKLIETKRSNLANESLKGESNAISADTNVVRMRELDETIAHNNAKEEQMLHQNALLDAQQRESMLKGHQAYWKGEVDRVSALPYKAAYDGDYGEWFIAADYAVPAVKRGFDATVGGAANAVGNLSKASRYAKSGGTSLDWSGQYHGPGAY